MEKEINILTQEEFERIFDSIVKERLIKFNVNSFHELDHLQQRKIRDEVVRVCQYVSDEKYKRK